MAIRLVISLISILWGPVLGGFFLVYKFDFPFWQALAVILIALAVMNFFGLLKLEATREERPLTLVSFVFMILIMFVFLLVEGLEEELHRFEPAWFHPLIAVYLVFLSVAIFKEKLPMLQFYLALNGLVLALCWGGLLERKLSLFVL